MKLVLLFLFLSCCSWSESAIPYNSELFRNAVSTAQNREVYREAIINYYLWAYARLQAYLSSLGAGNRIDANPEVTSLGVGDRIDVKPEVVTEKPECKKIGELCVYHADCCSNACPSFLSKCVSQ